MNIKYWKNTSVMLLVFGIIFHLMLMALAMIFYTGGTHDNPFLPGYSFWGNTISDSGRYIAWSGLDNTLSMILLSSSLIIYAVLVVPFYLVISSLFNEGKWERTSSKLGTLFGILFSISYIGIAFTPADILYTPHMVFVFIGYISAFLNGIFYSITFYKNKEFPNHYALIFTIYTIVYFISILLGLIGLLYNRELMILFQKIGTFATIIAFLLIGYGIWKFEKK